VKSFSSRIRTSHYDGLNGENPPVKIISPMKDRKKIIILYPGASPHAEKHPQMEKLGLVLAQNGYKVFIPRIPPLKSLDISIINVNWFICFYKWLIEVQQFEPDDIIMAGISYGGGLMLKSLLEIEKTSKPPKMLMTYGTYADAKSTLDFLLTGQIFNQGTHYKITPHEWGLIVIVKNFLMNLDLDWDTTGVLEVLKLQIEGENNDRDKILSKLPKFQKDIANSIIKGKAIKEVKLLCNAIMENESTALYELSPKYWCHKINQKVFIFHGANDSMIPFTESMILNENLPNSDLLISYIYEHNEISTKRGTLYKLNEFIRMLHFFSKFYYYNEN